jgi:hypothetical protein
MQVMDTTTELLQHGQTDRLKARNPSALRVSRLRTLQPAHAAGG